MWREYLEEGDPRLQTGLGQTHDLPPGIYVLGWPDVVEAGPFETTLEAQVFIHTYGP